MDLDFIKTIFTQNGAIVALFVFTFLLGIFKGIPYLLREFNNVTTLFSETIKQLQETHEKDMRLISDVFISQIKESNGNHIITHLKLDEIIKNQKERK